MTQESSAAARRWLCDGRTRCALILSGDAGIYGWGAGDRAAEAEKLAVPIEVIPGVTAASAAAAALGRR